MSKHQAKKHFGQNFLTNKNLLNKIVLEADVKDKDVIEIGPGKGALTEYLAKYANSVTAFEIDQDLKHILKELESKNSNLKINFIDILKTDFPNDKEYDVVANIPYNITSPIVFKILEAENIKSATLMVQKEVCDRITASPGSKDYNGLTVIVNYYMEVIKLMNVNKKMFNPVPKVDSAVFKMTRKNKVLSDTEEKLFLKIVKASFQQKRKTILNNLHFTFDVEKSVLSKFLEENSIDPNERAENIGLNKYIELTKKWDF